VIPLSEGFGGAKVGFSHALPFECKLPNHFVECAFSSFKA
jgi:hypothetical protein